MNDYPANTTIDNGAGVATLSRAPRQARNLKHESGGSTAAYVAVAIIVWISFLRPFEWVSIVYRMPVGYLIGALSVIVVLVQFFGSQKSFLTTELKWFVLVCAQIVLAVPFAHWRGGAFEKVRHDVVVTLAMIVAIGMAASSLRRVRQLLWAVATSMTVLTAVSLISRTYDSEGRLMGRGGTYSNANDFGGYLAIAVPLCLLFLFSSKGALRKAFWAVAGLAMTYAIVATMSRSALLALAAGTMPLLWAYGTKRRKKVALLLLAGLIVGGLAVMFTTHYGTRVIAMFGGSAASDDRLVASAVGSANDRKQLFWRAVDVSLHHPLLGVGAGNFYAYSGAKADDWHVSHNTFTQLSAENGIPALLFYLLMVRTAFRHLRELSRKVEASMELLLLVGALRSAMLAMLIAIFFADTGYLFLPYFFPALAGALWNAEIGNESAIDKQKERKSSYRFLGEQTQGHPQHELSFDSLRRQR